MTVRAPSGSVALAGAAIVVALVGASLWAERSVPAGLLPHGVCFTWLPALLWLHVVSDALIGLAYLSIPLTLFYLVRRRRDLPFHGVFVLFALFIVSCGLTHLIGIWTIWNPDYWFAGSMKAITAAVSLVTAAVMVPLVPRALALPTTQQLKTANVRLEEEVAMRRRAQEELLQSQSLLEQRVSDRTWELTLARATAEHLRAEAEHANQMKDKFLAKVSHELRTPLQAMLSWSGVLAAQTADGTIERTAASRIADSVAAQARLIDDLLDISRILSGKLRLELQSISLREVIARAVEVVAPTVAAAGVTIETLVPDEATLVTDAARLEQVLWNLLVNAVQASQRGQRIQLTAKVEADRLELTVSDDGRGIDAADLAGIFEPFRQAQPSNKHRGLGLGLAITRSIVSLLGGTIRAHSVGPGRGASFVVVLPLIAGTAAAPSTTRLTEPELIRLAGARVLYVEDDPDVAAAVSQSLSAFVKQIDVCSSPEAALGKAREGNHDVLVCDLDLGEGQTGASLLRRLRTSTPPFRAPAIALSAYGADHDRRESHDAGFLEHLTKPVRAEDLARAVATALLAGAAA